MKLFIIVTWYYFCIIYILLILEYFYEFVYFAYQIIHSPSLFQFVQRIYFSVFQVHLVLQTKCNKKNIIEKDVITRKLQTFREVCLKNLKKILEFTFDNIWFLHILICFHSSFYCNKKRAKTLHFSLILFCERELIFGNFFKGGLIQEPFAPCSDPRNIKMQEQKDMFLFSI